jgi:C-terminal processing protease CtpA/Prc
MAGHGSDKPNFASDQAKSDVDGSYARFSLSLEDWKNYAAALKKSSRWAQASGSDLILAQNCPFNPDYNKIVDTAASRHLNVPKTQELLKLRDSDAKKCFQTSGQAFDGASEDLKVLGDPFTLLIKTSGGQAQEHDYGKKSDYLGIGFSYLPVGAGGANLLVIEMVRRDGAGNAAGLVPGDVVVGVNDDTLIGVNSKDSMRILFNNQNKAIENDGTLKLHLQDGTVKNVKPHQSIASAVWSQMKDDKVLYLKIAQFAKEAALDIQKEFNYWRKNGGFDGVVIDLRYSGGGLTEDGVQALSLFVDQGEVLKYAIRSKDAAGNELIVPAKIEIGQNQILIPTFNNQGSSVHHIDRLPVSVTEPVAILVNDGTRSISEAFAKVMKSRGLATIIGQPTGGKIFGQHYYDVNGGALKVSDYRLIDSTAELPSPEELFPNGGVNTKYGIRPDIVITDQTPVLPGSAQDPYFQAALQALKDRVKR